MDRYIGLDVHAASCTLAVVGPSGRRLKSVVVETSGSALVDALRSVPGQRRMCMEEGTQSQWLYEILSPHVAELVVAGIGAQRSYGPKSDKRDAFALAEGLRVGSIETRVHKGLGQYRRCGSSCARTVRWSAMSSECRGDSRRSIGRGVCRRRARRSTERGATNG